MHDNTGKYYKVRNAVYRVLFFIVVVISLVCDVGIARTTVFDVEGIGEYVMGDSDTKLEARRIAMEQAKRNAVEKIGTYLDAESIVVNNALTKDEIRTYTAAVIKTTVLSEAFALQGDKSTIIKIKIKANVDTSLLEKKIKEIKEDSQRSAQLALLRIKPGESPRSLVVGGIRDK